MNGRVDDFGRALITVSIQPAEGNGVVELPVWIDTGFNGDIVLPQSQIAGLNLHSLEQSKRSWRTGQKWR